MQSARPKKRHLIRFLVAGILGASFMSPGTSGPPPRVSTMASAPAPNLVDPSYPPGIADEGWQYRESVAADLDGDGANETVWVIARAGWNGQSWDFDDGQPWQVYVEEADGTRTYLYSNWVQFGTLEVGTSEVKGQPSVVILERQGFSFALYRVRYDGPGLQQAEGIGLAQLTHRTNPHFPPPKKKPGQGSSAFTSSQKPSAQPSLYVDNDYRKALRVANDLLVAWYRRDWHSGQALLTAAAKAKHSPQQIDWLHWYTTTDHRVARHSPLDLDIVRVEGDGWLADTLPCAD